MFRSGLISKRGAWSKLPAAALIFRSKGPQVAVIDSNDIVHFRPITIARDDGDVVEIEAGFSPGDRVALNISDAVTDGERVARGWCDAEGRGSVRFTANDRRARRRTRRSSGIPYALTSDILAALRARESTRAALPGGGFFFFVFRLS